MQKLLQNFGILPPNNETVLEAQFIEQHVIGCYLMGLQEGLFESQLN